MDGRVLAYLIAISIATGVLFGLAPAGRLWRLDVNATLKDGGHGAAGGRRGHLSRFLVTAELALAIVLLAGAGVMIRQLSERAPGGSRRPSGQHPHGPRQLCRASGIRMRPRRRPFFGRLQSVSGAAGRGIGSPRAVSYPGGERGRCRTRPRVRAGRREATRPGARRFQGCRSARPTSGRWALQLVSGRDFNESDGAPGSEVTIVNRMLREPPVAGRGSDRQAPAALRWKRRRPVAERRRRGVEYRAERSHPAGVRPRWCTCRTGSSPARARGPSCERAFLPASLAMAVRRAVQGLDAELPISVGPVSLVQRLAPANRYRGFTAALFMIFAGIAAPARLGRPLRSGCAFGEPPHAGDRHPDGDWGHGRRRPRAGLHAGDVAAGNRSARRAAGSAGDQPRTRAPSSSACHRPIRSSWPPPPSCWFPRPCSAAGYRPAARCESIRLSRCGTSSLRSSHRAVQGDGLNLEPSGSLLKFVLVTNGSVRNCGSSTIVVTTNHVSPLRSFDRSKYSETTALAL